MYTDSVTGMVPRTLVWYKVLALSIWITSGVQDRKL